MENSQNLPAVAERKITVFATQEQVKYEYITGVRTYGELQKLIPNRVVKSQSTANGTSPVSFNNKNVRVKENRNSLELESALLPDSDCTLFVYPKQSKGGSYKTNEIRSVNYNIARSTGSQINKKFSANLNINGSKEEMLNVIDNWMKKNNKSIDDVNKAPEPEKGKGGRKSTTAPVSKPVAQPKAEKKPVSKEQKQAVGGVLHSLKNRSEKKSATPHVSVLEKILSVLKSIDSKIDRIFTEVDSAQLHEGTKTVSSSVSEEENALNPAHHPSESSSDTESQPEAPTETNEEIEERIRKEEEAKAEQERKEREKKEEEERKEKQRQEDEARKNELASLADEAADLR